MPHALSYRQLTLYRLTRLMLPISASSQNPCCMCGKQQDDAGSHADSCTHLAGTRVHRHNAFRDVVYNAVAGIKHGFATREPRMDAIGFQHNGKTGGGRALPGVVKKADVSLKLSSESASPDRQETLVVDMLVVSPSSYSNPTERGKTTRNGNGDITAGGGSEDGHAIKCGVRAKQILYDPFDIPNGNFIPAVMTSVGAYSFHASSLLRRVARMQLRDTVRDPTVESAVSMRGRIPYSVRLRTLMDAASIAVVRAQMNLLDRYITICVRGDFRVLAAADRRRAAARVNARAQSARASGLPPG